MRTLTRRLPVRCTASTTTPANAAKPVRVFCFTAPIFDRFVEGIRARKRSCCVSAIRKIRRRRSGRSLRPNSSRRFAAYCEIGAAEGATRDFRRRFPRRWAMRSNAECSGVLRPTLRKARTASFARRSSDPSRFSSVSTTKHEAIALANDSEYGLAASVWTSNIGRANRVARAIRSRFGRDQHAVCGLPRRAVRRLQSPPDTGANWEWRRCASTAKPKAFSPTLGRNRWTRSEYSGLRMVEASRRSSATARRMARSGKTGRTFRAVRKSAWSDSISIRDSASVFRPWPTASRSRRGKTGAKSIF